MRKLMSGRIGRRGLSSKGAYATVALAAIMVLAALALVFNPQSSQLATSQTGTSRSTLSQTAATQVTAGQSSSSKSQGSLLLALGDTPRVLGPGTTLDYTLAFVGNVTGPYSLAYSSPTGISFKFTPSVVAFAGNRETAYVEVNTSESMVPGDYDIIVVANGSAGSFSTTFKFTVVQHLIIAPVAAGSPGNFVPGNLTVKAKSTVTWLSLDFNNDGVPMPHQVNFKTLDVTSPVLQQFDLWSYTFEQAGTFTYSDLDNPGFQGTIVVTG